MIEVFHVRRTLPRVARAAIGRNRPVEGRHFATNGPTRCRSAALVRSVHFNAPMSPPSSRGSDDPPGCPSTVAPPNASPHFITLIAGVAALGGFLFGFDSGVINGTVTALSTAFASDALGTGFAVASMLLGCALGALVAGPLADRWGRKPLMMLTASLFAVSAWGSGVADGVTEFIVYRILGGIGVGAASVLAPAYISEVAPAARRGRLASLQQLGIVLGLFAAFMSNYLLSQAAGGAAQPLFWDLSAWRWMFWMELVPAVAFFFGALVIPESPRFLVAAGREGEALRVFALFAERPPETAVLEVQRSLERSHRPALSDLFEAGRLRPIVWVGIALSVFQQFVGINVVFYYGEVLWRAVGFSESEALQINLLGGAVNIFSTLVAMSLIDRVGRKPLLQIGSLGMGAGLCVLAGALATATHTPEGALHLSTQAGTLALIAANLYVFCFGASWGPVVWVLLGEVFGNQFRGAALSASAGAQWLANFAITMTFPILLGSIGVSAAYCLYATCALLSWWFVRRYVKETRGHSLESMGR